MALMFRLSIRTLALAALLAGVLPAQKDLPPPMVVLVIGPPGSGKTTQAARLSRRFRIPSISMADVLKREGGGRRADKKVRVNVAADVMNDTVANELIDKRLARRDTDRGFILDGYPVTHGQAEYLEKILQNRRLPMPTVLFLDVPDSVALERMKGRGRSDDKPDLMQLRLDEYHKQSKAVLERYRGDQLKTIDATKSADDVWTNILRALTGAK
jgi:adenylate kinase